jgi:hypothetical protein
MSPSEFYSFEEQFENAFNALLKNAGFNALPLFPESGITVLPEDAVRCSFELAETDESVLAFRTLEDGSQVSDPAGFTGTIEITHCVPVSDDPGVVGMLAPYPRLRAQRGRIRALMRNGREQLQELLPWYDILSLDFSAPRHRMDTQKLAHEATETLRIRFTGRPLDGMPS